MDVRIPLKQQAKEANPMSKETVEALLQSVIEWEQLRPVFLATDSPSTVSFFLAISQAKAYLPHTIVTDSLVITSCPTASPVSNQVTPWVQLGQQLNGEFAIDSVGSSMALSADGLTLATGNDGNDGTGIDAGHARVFRFNSGSQAWLQLGQDLDGGAAHDGFGNSLTLSADGLTMAVGASNDDNGNGSSAGLVRVFQYNDSSQRWVQLGQDLNGDVANDRFGGSVALSADGLTTASEGSKNDSGDSTGYVRVFQISKISWQWFQLGQDINGRVAGDYFGRSVALSADGLTMAAAGGGTLNVDDGRYAVGFVRIFQYNKISQQWVQLGQDFVGNTPGGELSDGFGNSVALSADGSIVAVGAPFNYGSGDGAGYVHVFQSINGGPSPQWIQLGQQLNGEATNDRFGYSVSLSADGLTMAVGATTNDGNGSDVGNVRIFQYNDCSQQWVQLGQDLNGEAATYWFGNSVALSAEGLTVAAGGFGNDGNGNAAGHVRVYTYPS